MAKAKHLSVIPASISDVIYVTEHIRESDRQEIEATIEDVSPGAALLRSFEDSIFCNCITCDGVPMCVYGVGSAYDGWFSPWLIGTDEVDMHKREFMVLTRGIFKGLSVKYKKMFNFVDARNSRSIAWLQWLGFDIGEALPVGVDGALFHVFRKVGD